MRTEKKLIQEDQISWDLCRQQMSQQLPHPQNPQEGQQ